MSLVKTILRNTALEVIVKFTGSGTDTITLPSLVSSTQTVDGTPTVYVTGVSLSTLSTGSAKVTRNSVDAISLSGNFNYNPASFCYAPLTENATTSIVVNLTTEGTLIIKLQKDKGYSKPFEIN